MPGAQQFNGPADFFDETGRPLPLPDTPEEFYQWLCKTDSPAFIDRLHRAPSDRSDRLLFRGQRDASWGLHSLLYRSLIDAGLTEVDEGQLDDAEKALIPKMRAQGLGRLMTDGQLMSVMQHHGLPTRLIDVSKGAREALYFAVDKEDRTDGRLFVIQPPAEYITTSFQHRPDATVEPDQQTAPWVGESMQQRRYVVSAVEDPSLDPRMQAQRGIFLTGGLPYVRYGGVATLRYKGENLTPAQQTDVSNLYFAWPRVAQAGALHSSSRWAAWSFCIPSKWKPALRALLKPDGIERKTMFPKYAETELLAVHLAAQAGGAGPA